MANSVESQTTECECGSIHRWGCIKSIPCAYRNPNKEAIKQTQPPKIEDSSKTTKDWLEKSQFLIRDIEFLVKHGYSEKAYDAIDRYWKEWRHELTGQERQEYDFIYHGITPL